MDIASSKIVVNNGDGLNFSATSGGKAKLQVKADDGIAVSADGVKADVDTGKGLELTNTNGSGKIAVKVDNSRGTQFESGRITLRFAASEGLVLNEGGYLRVPIGRGIKYGRLYSPASSSGVHNSRGNYRLVEVNEGPGLQLTGNDYTINGGGKVQVRADDGISVSGDGVKADVDTGTGLVLSNTNGSGKIQIKADDGIALSSDGVKADVDTGTGLKLSNTNGSGKIQIKKGGGIAFASNELVANIDRTKGLDTISSKIVVNNGDGLNFLRLREARRSYK